MSKPRINMYSGIHKALRSFMSDTQARLARTDAADNEDLHGALAQTRELLQAMRKHLEHEGAFVHPAMNARRPGSAQVTEGDHDHHDWAIDKLLALCDHCATAIGSARFQHLDHLHLQLSVFVGENLVHMNLEETENNAVLWACYTDEELHEIHDRIVAAIPPEEMQATMRWMIPSLNPAERAGMLLGMRAGMPPPVFEGVLAMTRSLISARDMQKLEAALAAPQALAA
ncbi:hemerythrin domain-containing protein [Pseudoduganella sp. OTU4001]|uniref:hemerythrin domain-containing protein n=1 Tax=Pseudoduganella sp. OTU4001 TaxID=3043854 RepID=UPI00313B735C